MFDEIDNIISTLFQRQESNNVDSICSFYLVGSSVLTVGKCTIGDPSPLIRCEDCE